MVVWMSDAFRASMGLDQDCMANRLEDDVTHDNMFSTVIDMLDVVTGARDAALDLAADCRTKAS